MNIQNAPVYAVILAVVMLILFVIGYLYYSLYRYKLQAINAGLEDEIIKKEYIQSTGKISKVTDRISVLFTAIVFVFFAVSFYAGTQGNYFPIKGMGTFQVVASGSMSHIAEGNTYLTDNNLTNQFDTYDIIGIQPVESAETLKLYDVVVYKNNDKLVVHRIVDIVEKDGEKQFILRGDANRYDDANPVIYKDIIGRYTGFKIPMMGIFIIFLQSALGYVAMGLVLIVELITPIFEKKIDKAIKRRLQKIGYITE